MRAFALALVLLPLPALAAPAATPVADIASCGARHEELTKKTASFTGAR